MSTPEIFSLIVIVVLFLLSLAAAVILFAFFKSTAVVQGTRYQAGGAIAGFIIVFVLLHLSYVKIAGYEKTLTYLRDSAFKKDAQITSLQAFTNGRDISGSVDPYADNTKIAVVLSEADLPINKKFRMTAPCVDLKKSRTALYVIQEGRSHLYELLPDDDLSALSIRIPPSQ